MKMIESYLVPVPPVEIQSEIVGILDGFTNLLMELNAELTARKTQYAYYRDKLLQHKMPTKEYEVGEICEVSAGGDVPKEHFSKEKSEQYKVPVISNGCGINAFYGYTDAARVDNPAVTVAARGTIGYAEYRDYPYFPIIRLITLIPRDDKQLNAKYLYYSLEGRHYKVPTSGIPQLTVPVMKKEKVVIPSLDVQNRIVNVLDNFEKICSDLNIGLPAEIEARQKQYEYYRDKLLTFAETGNTILSRAEQSRAEQSRAEQSRALIKLLQYVFGYAVVTLEDIAENCDSMRKPVTSGKREAGEYPYYGASGIVDYVKGYIFDGDYLLVSEDGANLLARSTPIAFSISGKNWVNNHAHVLKFDCYETRRFVEFYLNSIDLAPYISGGAQPKLNQKNLNRIEIPLPSQERQKYIVDILDRFDAICNDLTSGLPAEIEARQRQYEYYRDKLLTFKERG